MGADISPNPGDLFQGRYLIDDVIGEGGFSQVYRATDKSNGNVVALKVLVSKNDPSLAERFLREAQVLRSLDENHIIKLFDHGSTPDGLLYMAFEYVEGKSLFEYLRDHGKMAPERVAYVMQQILQALQAAHAQGILHRDIKPNNVMLQGDNDYVKVLDFGIAKAFGAEIKPGEDLTAAGTLIGTPRYMSPEQIGGQPVGPPSDIYALGMLSIELLTGRKSLTGKDRMEILQQQLSHTPNLLPTELHVPGKLRDIVERMTAKDTRIRYSSAAAVLRDLIHWNNNVADVDATMLANPSDVSVQRPEMTNDGDSTVMQRVQTHELPTAPIQRQSPTTPNSPPPRPNSPPNSFAEPPPTSQNFSAPQTDQASNPWGAQTGNASASGTWQASGSGSFPQASSSGSWPHASSSGSWPHASSSGSWPHASPSGNWQQPAPSGNWPLATQNTSITAGPVVLSGPQKAILVVSFFVPGVAHLAFGQTKKGILLLVIFFLSLGSAIIVSLAFVFDAFLVLRAKRSREVGDFEFFPGYKEFFG